MASIALSTVEPSQRRRRPLTYGKQSRQKSQGFDHDFSHAHSTKSAGNPTRLTKPSLAVRRIAEVLPRSPPSKSSLQASIFDVPLSDDESPQPLKRRKLSGSFPSAMKHLQSPKPIGSPSRSGKSAVAVRRIAEDASSPLSSTSLHQMSIFDVPLSNEEPPQPSKRQKLSGSSPSGTNQPSTPKRSLPRQISPLASSEKVPPSSRTSRGASISIPQPLIRSSPEKSRNPMSQVRPSTPPPRAQSAVATPRSLKVTTTPKQARLWDSLLQKQTYPDRSRRRLVDTLVASARDAPSDMSQSEEEEEQRPAHPMIQLTKLDSPRGSQQSQAGRHQSKITYAGQRSYLEEAECTFDQLLAQPLIPGPSPMDASVKNKANTSNITPSDLNRMDSGDEDDAKPMRTIHELRAAGDSLRLEDELLLGDLEGSGKSALSGKRSALLEWCNKLPNAEFRERFIQNGLEHRIMARCGADTDPIVGAAVSGILAYVLGLPGSVRTPLQVYRAGAVTLLSNMLDVDRGLTSIARDRRSNMSKVAQTSVHDFQTSILKSSLFENSHLKSVSPRLLALKALELLIRRSREDDNREIILTDTLLSKLLHNLEGAVQEGRNGSEHQSPSDHVYLRTILSTLESFTVAEACALEASLWTSERLKQLVTALDVAMRLQGSQVDRIHQLVLRICLNLANNNEEACEAFGRPHLIEKIVSSINAGFKSLPERQADNDPLPDFDSLLLCLGALFNLAEWSDSVRLMILDLNADGLDAMLVTLIGSRENTADADSLAASSANVAYGYLAVLLGNLCQNKKIRKHVQAKLPNRSLVLLVEAVEEFITYHKEADRRQQGKGNENWVVFTDRLQRVAQGLKAFASGSV